jgi:hypothetical protein
MLLRKLWSKTVETMCGVSSPSEEDQRQAIPAPIQNFKLNALLNRNELHFMRRQVRLSQHVRE